MKIFLLAIFSFTYAYNTVAQEAQEDMQALKLHIRNVEIIANAQGKSSVRIQKTYNPGKLLLFVPLYCYQRVISEQISAVCGFEPSCSGFSILAIKKLGIFKGLLLTADRLMRCNGEAQTESEYYLFDTRKSKVIDEPEMYRKGMNDK